MENILQENAHIVRLSIVSAITTLVITAQAITVVG